MTICTHGRLCLFGTLVAGKMQQSEAGAMIGRTLLGLEHRFPAVALDAWAVMPDHLHAILLLEPERAVGRTSLGEVIGALKSLTTTAYIGGVQHAGWPTFVRRLWQRNYYEHIVRDEDDLNRIRAYIEHQSKSLRATMQSIGGDDACDVCIGRGTPYKPNLADVAALREIMGLRALCALCG